MSSEKRGILRSLFNPRYDEVSLFVMSITFIMLYIINKTMRSDLHKLASAALRETERGSTAAGFVLLAICFIGGICFSIYHAFSSREKTAGEKGVMLFFAIPVTGGTGLYAGKWMLANTGGWLIIFPVCNVIASGVLLIKFARMITRGRIDVSCISDRDATRGQIILGLIAAAIILVCCQYWFGLHWAVTFSICVAYASTVNEAVQGLVMPFVALRQTGEQQFRTACRDAIADGKLTIDEKRELKSMIGSLGMSKELAKRIFEKERNIFLSRRGPTTHTQAEPPYQPGHEATGQTQQAQSANDHEQRFRSACRKAIADGKLTLDEKHELTTLAKSLAISRQLAKQLFDDEKRILLKNRHRK